MTTFGRVLDSITVQFNVDHVTASGFHCFLDSNRHFTCLTAAKADLTVTVTNHGQCGEGKDTTTFNSLGNTIDLYQLFLEAFVVAFFFLRVCHILTLRIPVQLHAQRQPGLLRDRGT